MKYLRKMGIAILILISLSGTTGCGTSFMSVGVQYTNPSWAPPYHPGARYYYLPDIEVYYDLSGGEFVYLDNGRWMFAGSLPSLYSGYDLFNSFVVVLNFSIYQPWMHHHEYVSHYPRYYYHNTYQDTDFPNIRGFNENDRKPIYWRKEDRDRIPELKRTEKDRAPFTHKEPQKTNYYGKKIGFPVKVKAAMKEIKKKQNKKN